MDKTRVLMGVLGIGGELTLCELGSLVVVAGREAGFEVYPEHSLGVGLPGRRNGVERTAKLDCAWFNGDVMLVAWEFDARDVSDSHLNGNATVANRAGTRIGNVRKFQQANAAINIQALYSVRDALTGAELRDRIDAVRQVYRAPNVGVQVQVVSDVELIAGQIIEIAAQARELA